MLLPKGTDRLNGYIQDPYTCCLQETHFRPKHTYTVKVRGWKTQIPCRWKPKES